MKQFLLSLVLALVAVGCGSSDGGDDGGDFIPTDPSQVEIQFSATEIVVGTGAEALLGRTVVSNFELWLFDPNGPDGKGKRIQGTGDPNIGSLTYTIGTGQLIAGVEQGTIGMKVGGKRRLYIPYQLAYGANPPAGSGIPPFAALVFELVLLEVN